VDPRAGLDDVEKRKFLTLLGLELRPLGRPTRSQSAVDKAQNLIVWKCQQCLCCYVSIAGNIDLARHYVFFCLFCDCDSWLALLVFKKGFAAWN
jgi:hypothetical protein